MALAAHQFSVLNDAGDIQPGAEITVTSETAGPPPSLFEDRDGITPLGNPFTTSDGHVRFYVEGGGYRIDAVAGAFTRTFRNVGIGTMQERDADDFVEVTDLPTRIVDVEDFGAIAYTQAELEALNGAASIDDQAATNTTAFQNASDHLESLGGGILRALGQIYVKDGVTEVGRGVMVVGSGVGYWNPIFAARPKTWTGTTILMKGVGTQDHSFVGVTSMKHAGGWREDPDNGGQFFKLTSFMNSDASDTTPATARQFSVAFKKKAALAFSDNWGLRDLRITNWSGTDGIEGHSDQASIALGDAWDIGILIENSEYCRISNVQCVGDWREFALLLITPGFDDAGLAERNLIEHSIFQGRVGMGFRSADRWAITSKTSTTVEIYFSDESYWPTSGTFRGSDNVIYTYTGVSHTGTATSFTFTGVTPDPDAAGIFQVRNLRGGSGFANTEVHDCLAYGLEHVSGNLASDFSLVDSRALEMSGNPLRGVKFRNFKALTLEGQIAFLHDTTDTTFIDPQWEGGGHLIASPEVAAASYADAPVGETRGLIMFADLGVDQQDLRLFLPRNGIIQGRQIGLADDLSGDTVLKPLRTGKVLDLHGSDGSSFVRLQHQEWTPSFGFVTVSSYTVQSGTYFQIGKIVHFVIDLTWSGLDTDDESNVNISLPVAPDSDKPVSGQIFERLSTGIDLSSLTRPHLDIALSGDSLGITQNRTSRVLFDTPGVMAAAGSITVSGTYWAA